MNDVKKNKYNIVRLCLIASLCLYAGLSVATLTTIVDDANNTNGLDDVLVGTAYYDVRFHEVWNSTYNTGDLSFATLASTALYDLIKTGGMLQGTEWDYGTKKEVGCTHLSLCVITTVHTDRGSSVDAESVNNWSQANDRFDFPETQTFIDPLQIDDTRVWAQWTRTTPVPVPATVWLMGSGLLGLLGFSRKVRSHGIAA